MESNDEIIKIQYQYDRIRYYKDEHPEFYKIMEETKEDIKIRIVIFDSKDGEKIILATNLSKKEFDYEKMFELYKLNPQGSAASCGVWNGSIFISSIVNTSVILNILLFPSRILFDISGIASQVFLLA